MVKKVRLGPGGKILLVLAGLGVIGFGLDRYGYLDPVRGWFESDPPPPVVDPAPPAPPAPGVTPSDPPPRAPPPLQGVSSTPLRRGGAEVWESWIDPDFLLRELREKRLDLVPIELHDLVYLGASTKGFVVVGAVTPLHTLSVCAHEKPLEVLRAGVKVRADTMAQRMLIGHLAEVKGFGAAAVAYTQSGGADAWIRQDAPRDGEECLSLVRLGAQGPRLVLARASDARLFGRSYHDAVKEMGGLAPKPKSYLLAAGSDERGYPYHAGYLAGLAAKLYDRPYVSPPPVARFIISPDGPNGTRAPHGPPDPK